MTTRKLKDKRHPKIINDFMVYEGINDINSVFGALTVLDAYIQGDKFQKYAASMAIDSIRSTLCAGTGIIEQWLEIEDEVKP
tara:strand:- start:599 stop:844 length:246 start_codon:yes stop_codon:yes gene_type:complete